MGAGDYLGALHSHPRAAPAPDGLPRGCQPPVSGSLSPPGQTVGVHLPVGQCKLCRIGPPNCIGGQLGRS